MSGEGEAGAIVAFILLPMFLIVLIGIFYVLSRVFKFAMKKWNIDKIEMFLLIVAIVAIFLLVNMLGAQWY